MDPDVSDVELVERLRQGDAISFRAAYRRYSGRIFAFLVRLAGQRDVAEDANQETWLAAARHVRRLRPESDLGAWLFTIARNQLRSAKRRPAAHIEQQLGEISDGHHPVTATDSDPSCRDLEAALQALPDAHREILLLFAVEGLSIEQVAEVLRIRPDAARQRLSRARAALAALLATDSSGESDPASLASGGVARRARRTGGGA